MLAKIRKALTAALGAGLAAFVTARSDLTVTTEEWVGIVALLVATGVVTWLVPNKQEPAAPPLRAD
jgi:hypothetical protein